MPDPTPEQIQSAEKLLCARIWRVGEYHTWVDERMMASGHVGICDAEMSAESVAAAIAEKDARLEDLNIAIDIMNSQSPVQEAKALKAELRKRNVRIDALKAALRHALDYMGEKDPDAGEVGDFLYQADKVLDD